LKQSNVVRKTADKIGRFELQGILGEGSQGKVYLAFDPHLERKVAIKTLAQNSSNEQSNQLAFLMQEARAVSILQHANIVTLYDAAEYDGEPYLIFEYVEGTTLRELIISEGGLTNVRTAEIALDILSGVAYAHSQGVIHCDLKPANIMIDTSGVARIMDFGIAKTITNKNNENQGFLGTPLYAAPERFSGSAPNQTSEMFSIGMICYEMLCGKNPAVAATFVQVQHRICHDNFAPPSSNNSNADEKLGAIILKALEKRPEDRYADAQTMIAALKEYQTPSDISSTAHDGNQQSTIEFLMRRMRHKSDFPAFSGAIRAINRLAGVEKESVDHLSGSILRDFSLTNKLLRIVNTACFGQFGNISTVSRAVVILGFDNVRSIATALMLFEHLQNKNQANQLKDEIYAAYLNGLIAKELTGTKQPGFSEEAFICAMFLNLGKLLATFYFHDESLEINKIAEQQHISENAAAIKVLGVSYEDLAVAIAQSWNFPQKIVESMRVIEDEEISKPRHDGERLRVVANLAGQLREIAASTDVASKHARLEELAERYKAGFSMNHKQLSSAVGAAFSAFMREAAVLNINVKQSGLIGKVSKWSGVNTDPPEQRLQSVANAETQSDPELAATVATEQALEDTVLKMVPSPITAELTGVEAEAFNAEQCETILLAGIQDVTNTLIGEYSLNDLLRMVVETIYRGFKFSRVMLALKDTKQNALVAKFGLGQDIEILIKQFILDLKYEPNVFHVALAKEADILIEDVNADKIKSHIPSWYFTMINAPCFALFPIVVNKKVIGLIYADQLTPGKLKIEATSLALLKNLRNQVILAIKQKLL
jgi:eukaryotic-like serine/threonine-protein kinase